MSVVTSVIAQCEIALQDILLELLNTVGTVGFAIFTDVNLHHIEQFRNKGS